VTAGGATPSCAEINATMTMAMQVWRRIGTRPGLTAASVSMLALAVGLATAMFAAADALVLRPVPFSEPDELAYLLTGDEHGASYIVSPTVFAAWRDSGAFAAVASASPDIALVTGALDGLQPRPMAWVTPDLFDLLGGVRPIAGRLFAPGEGRAGADDRVLLSEAMWWSAFGGDPGIVGRRIVVGDERVEVVGVLPASFRFPAWDTVLWRPLDFAALPPARLRDRPRAIARFGSVPRADALTIATRLAREHDGALAEKVAQARPLVAAAAYDRRAVPLLSGAVALVFVVLCVNVAALRIVQLGRRQRDFAVGLALGASRARILRESSLDGLLVGLAGVAGGVALGWTLVSVAGAHLPPGLVPTLNPVAIDARAVIVMGALGLLVTVVTAIWPAWRAARVDAIAVLGAVPRTATASRGTRLVVRTMLVAEMALACVLLVSAALLVRTFLNLSRADRGLDTAGVLTAWVNLPREAFPEPDARRAAVAAMDASLRALPGVGATTWSAGVPPAGGGMSFGAFTGSGEGGRQIDAVVDRYTVGPDFFALYGVPLARGRGFRAGDEPSAVIVGEGLARRLWPGLDPLERAVLFGSESMRVVGVAREIHYPSVDATLDRPEIYQPFTAPGRLVTASVRCGSVCPSLGALRERLLAASPGATVWKADRLDDVYQAQLARPRAVAVIGAGFAAIAAVAAIGGLFCVLTFAVAERRRELGIRAALGALPARLGRLVLVDGLGVALAGLVVGAVGAVALGRTVAALHYGVTIGDATTWIGVMGSLILLAVAACIRPVREAMRVDLVRLLRHE
jgi:predicted permease